MASNDPFDMDAGEMINKNQEPHHCCRRKKRRSSLQYKSMIHRIEDHSTKRGQTMNFFILCTLVYIFSVIVSEALFLQSPPVQNVSVRSTVKLHCHTGCLARAVVYWYKQQGQEHLQLLYIVTKYVPPNERFSGEFNNESTIYTLVIQNVQRNDSGLYYCAARPISRMPFVFGNGSKMLVTGRPDIFLLTPPLNGMFSMGTVTLVCLLNNFVADVLHIRWNISTWDTESWTDSETIISSEAYSIRSYIRVPANALSYGASCICSLQINSTAILNSKSVSFTKESSIIKCLSTFSVSFVVVIVLLLAFTFATAWTYRNRQSDNWKTDSLEKQETLYAHLAFTADQTF
ncbi:T cell receptor alpha chain MC.7.G5-like [Rhincodon typus]|uniref:T cell receptor alpha chain MC.7.G5-like n=1 Tax=Rhincodon typus TaxID=259920 RepID=UPI00202FC79D|nr:T cell receptor alpha chain MC.7.G5-like [Rhincodon typus]